jgi:hypothetical protein
MTDSSSKSKEACVITDNSHGRMYFGPPSKEKNSKEVFKLITKSGHHFEYNENGKKFEHIPGQSHELCGTDLEETKEDVVKSIVAREGDIAIIAENGNLKLKANNIYIEASGDNSDGSLLVDANDHVIIHAGEKLVLGGSDVCVVSGSSITLSAQSTLRQLYTSISVSESPLSGITALFSGPLGWLSLVKQITETCK